MPQHPLAPIDIRIDTQEQRSGIPALLAAMPQVHIEMVPLRVDHSLMRPESIRGALTYITAILRVPILPSSGPAESAHLVYAAARQCQVGQAAHSPATHGPAEGRRRATQSEQQMQIVLSLPGIGPITARAVCARFRNLHDLLSANSAQFATVPGVGPSRAAALEQLLHAALPTSHGALKSKERKTHKCRSPTT
jgi:ERCC4-type nuclease